MIEFIPDHLCFQNFGSTDEDNEEYGRVFGLIKNGKAIVGTSYLNLTEEELEIIRPVIRSASKRNNKLINN